MGMKIILGSVHYMKFLIVVIIVAALIYFLMIFVICSNYSFREP